MTSIFLRHEPCLSCHSRDNLGCWSDGHKWCFGCGYYEGPVRTIANSRHEKDNKKDATSLSIDNLSTVIPEKPLRWLRKYGINDEEIKKYNFVWDSERQRLWSTILGPDIVAYQGRYFGTEERQPKYLSFGLKPKMAIYGEDTPCLIFCEDIISAIKIGRTYTASPVLGSHVPIEALIEAVGRFPQVGVWLDPDMIRRASEIVLRAQTMGLRGVFRVRSLMDPKDYSTDQIKEHIERAKLVLT